MKLLELFGWYGVAAILAAYIFANFGVIEFKGLAYHLLNLTGSIAIVAVTASKRDFQPAVLNIVWAIAALIGVISLL